MKLDRKYFNLVFSTLVALFMSFFMSFFMTLINVGFSDIFVKAWLNSFPIGFAIALPVSLFFIPKIRGFVEKLFN